MGPAYTPSYHIEIFGDHLSEDLVTDAMISICHSLGKTDGVKYISDEALLDDLVELDNKRTNIPEAMEGLNGVLSVIRDPESLGPKDSKRAKVAASSKTTHVMDLTDD